MLKGLFAKLAGLSEGDRQACGHVKDRAARMLALPEGSEITVSEIVCLDPACPGTETVLLVLAKGSKPRAVKFQMPADDVTDDMLRTTLVDAGYGVNA